tara:strand:+ start:193 stop:447 length:255 start_codon:yes stop_codon:yes gene_type:complete
MYDHFVNEEYLRLDIDLKEFTQRFLFLEYLEEWEQTRFKTNIKITLEQMLFVDLQLHIQDENYETAQLYKDVMERYKIDLPEFE